jgi:hypothetical protein
VIGPTPLLDFFKRGEADRDVRMEAAQGTLAPRAYEQLAILVLLVEDPDAEVRATAEETLAKIPEDVLKSFLARSDVPIGMREFFADRGIFPDEMPAIAVESEEPLLDAAAADSDAAILGDEDETRETATQRLAKMSFSQRLKAAVKGSREMRSILIRDPNKLIASSVLSSPKLQVSADAVDEPDAAAQRHRSRQAVGRSQRPRAAARGGAQESGRQAVGERQGLSAATRADPPTARASG